MSLPLHIDWPEGTPPEAFRLMEVLAAAGIESRFVGGCVRDALLGRAARDFDLATPAQPEEVQSAAEAAGFKCVPTGLAHGTVTVVVQHHPFEVTTLRRDVETDGRRARIAYTEDWREDAARRDFTFNALYAEADGTLHDPFGGREDLMAGRVRFVGRAADRITEDRLRLLRYFRFFAWYGRPPPDAEALEACARFAPELPLLSGERLRQEVLKLLDAPDPVPAWGLMREAGVTLHLLPEATRHDRLPALTAREAALGRPAALRRLGALLEGPDSVGPAARRLKLSNAERERLRAMLAPSPEAETLAQRLYDSGPEAALDRALLFGTEAEQEEILAALPGWTRPALPLTGHDLSGMGVAPGPAMGRVLRAVESWWRARNFTPSREDCLAEAARLAGTAFG
jgi:poly(A) polymerase